MMPSRGSKSQLLASEYHSTDFEWEDAQADAARLASLLRHHVEPLGPAASSSTDCQSASQSAASCWEAFHSQHASARFFRPRRYILLEFPVLANPNIDILELGCGAGATLLPILGANPTCRATGWDVSSAALASLRAAAAETAPGRLTTSVVDLEREHVPISPDPVDCVLLVFTLSALADESIVRVLDAARRSLKPGGCVLVRDYAIYDLVHLRFAAQPEHAPKSRYGLEMTAEDLPRTFTRGDGTLARFFSLEHLQGLTKRAGLQTVDARYACVHLRRAGRIVGKRVFLHAVFVATPPVIDTPLN